MKKTMLSFGGIGRRSQLWRGISLALASVMLFCSTFVYWAEKVQAVSEAEMEKDKIYYSINNTENYQLLDTNDRLQVYVGDVIYCKVVSDNAEQRRSTVNNNDYGNWDESSNSWSDHILTRNVFDDSKTGSLVFAFNVVNATYNNGECEIILYDTSNNPEQLQHTLPIRAVNYEQYKIYYRIKDKNGNYKDVVYKTGDSVELKVGEYLECFSVVSNEKDGFWTSSENNNYIGYTSDGFTSWSDKGDGTWTVISTFIAKAAIPSCTINLQGASSSLTVSIVEDWEAYELDTIYYKRIDVDGKYLDDEYRSDGYANLTVGQKLEVMVIIEHTDTPDNGNVGAAGSNFFILDADDDPSGTHGGMLDSDSQKTLWVVCRGASRELWQGTQTFEAGKVYNKDIQLYVDGKPRSTLTYEIKATEYETILVKSDFINDTYGFLQKDVATNMLYGNYQPGSDGSIWNKHNSYYDPFIVYIGREFEIKAQDVTSGTKFVLKEGTDHLSGESKGTSGIYMGISPGRCTIELQDDNGQVRSTLYVEVKYPIYVDTKVGEKHKDKVREYVLQALSGDQNLTFLDDNSGTHMYVKNADVGNARFMMFPGEKVTLIGYSDQQNTSFSGPGLSAGTVDKLPNNLYRITATYTAPNEEGSCSIDFGGEKIYIQTKVSGASHHFDIEVADGGTYTTSKTVADKNGTITKTITVYAAEVTDVNQCRVLNESGKNILPYEQPLTSGDYYKHNETDPTSTQFELTSAYETDGNGNLTSEPPAVAFRNVPRAQIKEVIFDVKLELFPKEKTVITTDANGRETVTTVEMTKDDDQKVVIESIVFRMDEDDIIAAYNKCPNQFGLDFTIVSELPSPEIEVKAVKTLKGETLQDKQFKFELYEEDPKHPNDFTAATVLRDIAWNHEDGGIVFSSLQFRLSFLEERYPDFTKKGSDSYNKLYNEQTGNYDFELVYFLKEYIPETETRYTYDPHVEKVIITFSMDRGLNIVGDRIDVQYYNLEKNTTSSEPPKFVNGAVYQLPDSGGSGVFIYVFGGGLLMAMSWMLFYLHKRRTVKYYITRRDKNYNIRKGQEDYENE